MMPAGIPIIPDFTAISMERRPPETMCHRPQQLRVIVAKAYRTL